MNWSEVVNVVLGGGLIAALSAVLTLRSTVRRAKAEASRAEADAETVRVNNVDSATRVLVDNIVEPLRGELNETRQELRATKKEFGATKREMARLRKAIDDAKDCRFSDDCPVLLRLRDCPKDDTGTEGQLLPDERHGGEPGAACEPKACATRTGAADIGTGQPAGLAAGGGVSR